MKLPFNMRFSSLDERNKFYEQFNLEKTKQWIQREVVYAMILGKHTDIVPKEYEQDKTTPLIIDEYQSVEYVQEKILQYLPEGVYYDQNVYKDISLCHEKDLRNVWDWSNFKGQELAFDIDPENVDCPIHGTLKQRLQKGMGLSFCEKAFVLAKKNTLDLFNQLSQQYQQLKIVFSGRGFHIHVLDEHTISYSRKKREEIAEKYEEYGIDKWVTTGEMRLIRVPFSLNAVSSRIVLPLKKKEIKQFDPSSEAIPDFLKD